MSMVGCTGWHQGRFHGDNALRFQLLKKDRSIKVDEQHIRRFLRLQDDCSLSAVGRCSLQDCSLPTLQAGVRTSLPHRDTLGQPHLCILNVVDTLFWC
jgi:hypothetical protein